MSRTSAWLLVVAPVLVAVALSGCAAQPDMIVADDQALCMYSSAVTGTDNYAQCRNRLQNTRVRMSAAGAARIEGYALLQAPVLPADVAGRCTTAGGAKDCAPGDVTGTIRSKPER